MGVSSTLNRVSYTGDGTTTAFTFPYYFFYTTDLVAYLYTISSGAVTALTAGIDFTVSGTLVNGVYSSGGVVTLTVSPSSLYQVVIVRVPSNVQNYALLQNGTVNSLALVQQLDYLTLLVQHLQDHMNRTTKLNRGDNETFNATLPLAMALNPNALLGVNSAGTGLSLVPVTTVGVPLPPKISGSKTVPNNITAAGGIVFSGTSWLNTYYVQSSGAGNTTITADPPIALPTAAGQRLRIIGCDDTKTVTINTGTNAIIENTIILDKDRMIDLEADTNLKWVESGRN